MKITVDTKEDSVEEIKKLIGLLNSLVEKEVVSNKDIFEQPQLPEVPQENVLRNIFEVDKDKEEPKILKKGIKEEKKEDSGIQIIY